MYDYGLELQISAVFPEADCSIFALLVNRLVINLTIPSSPVILLLPFSPTPLLTPLPLTVHPVIPSPLNSFLLSREICTVYSFCVCKLTSLNTAPSMILWSSCNKLNLNQLVV